MTGRTRRAPYGRRRRGGALFVVEVETAEGWVLVHGPVGPFLAAAYAERMTAFWDGREVYRVVPHVRAACV